MKTPTLVALTTLVALLSPAVSYPGMATALSALHHHASPADEDPKELIGDLLTLTDSQLTSIGKDIEAILLGTLTAESSTIDNSVPAALGSSACSSDTCCVWKWIAYDMTAKFNDTSGRCTLFARAAVRLGFHDAGAWSKTSSYGGADGSILLTDELMKTLYNKYHQYGVGMTDLIQMGATIASVVCPLGPRIRSFVGWVDNAKAAPAGLLPGVNDSADKLIALFKAKTIDPHGLAALVGAHTTSQQHFVDTGRDGDPQDSTPGMWDVKFYGETLNSVPPRVFKFASDEKLSVDSRTADEWKEFVGDQEHWNEDYAQEYVRLSLLGVNNINILKECTKVLPPRVNSFVAQDQTVLDLWLQGQFDQLNSLIDDSVLLTRFTSRTTIGKDQTKPLED
ncbi:heme peroxidase [Mytilinidion resinicola]|uniref:Peroxidase n=1 Tax=Mytilinidion resinicola TaxID=574789 RepID=A0A6A6YAR3_9PEZI|nr:heme peroxidase [Mytilinidion resinicola]KAF2805916.1 heme peroxidase [Mytilinidion resinicola]